MVNLLQELEGDLQSDFGDVSHRVFEGPHNAMYYEFEVLGLHALKS